ncbi:MAG: 16S rRNA (cytosine(967)-C(5))-methyltransferase RsmB [Lachnospiraceae bacterium]|nr:16S rRNA (cytosine(967)-C(5))-methyltransferase RsmB [Lachnospiraceae bacterium]
MNTREIILDILLELAKSDEYSNLLLAGVLEKYDYLDAKEKAFIKRVTEGTIERRIQIDYILDHVSKVPVKKMKPLIRELLRMSVYQLLFMEGTPDAAVCNEAVKLAKKRKFQSLQGYVNGVLRNVSRQKENIAYPDKKKDVLTYLSVVYSMPQWLVERFVKTYGEEKTEIILQAFLERGAVTIRLEESLSEEKRAELIREWEENGVVVKKHPYLSYAVQVEKSEGIRNLSGYEEGLFTVQDVSSMLVVEAAGIKEGQTVIDVCAAPGGKTLHAACKTGAKGKVLAFDLTENKVAKIEENRQRMGKENVTAAVGDARICNEALRQLADVVIADVPCSGLGVIGKKQDIKYHVTPQSLEEIGKLQKEIVSNVISYVKPGGIFMYSTCTINTEENEKMVEWICGKFPFEKESMEAFLPEMLKEEGTNGMIQLLPGVHKTDGFFFARLRRIE